MKMSNKDFRKWLRWAMDNPVREQTLLSILGQWEQEELNRQQPVLEFGTDFNKVRNTLENNHE